jgi:hypothetical protein
LQETLPKAEKAAPAPVVAQAEAEKAAQAEAIAKAEAEKALLQKLKLKSCSKKSE